LLSEANLGIIIETIKLISQVNLDIIIKTQLEMSLLTTTTRNMAPSEFGRESKANICGGTILGELTPSVPTGHGIAGHLCTKGK
jgi:hypothetical protein